MLKLRVRRAFNRAADTYDAAAGVQQTVVRQLLARLRAQAGVSAVVDVGCGTGYALSALRARHPQARLIAVDLAERMLEDLSIDCVRICADAERLPLAPSCTDLYWSSMAVQWCHLPAVLAEARRVVRPGGQIAIATLADRTFHELRAAFAGLDAYEHTHRFLSAAEVASCARSAGLSDIKFDRQELQAGYPDLPTLLRAVKAVGASEIAGQRRRGLLGRAAWTTALARYEAFRVDGLVPATYDVVYLTARSPD